MRSASPCYSYIETKQSTRWWPSLTKDMQTCVGVVLQTQRLQNHIQTKNVNLLFFGKIANTEKNCKIRQNLSPKRLLNFESVFKSNIRRARLLLIFSFTHSYKHIPLHWHRRKRNNICPSKICSPLPSKNIRLTTCLIYVRLLYEFPQILTGLSET